MTELHVLGAGSILPRDGYGCAGYALRSEPGAPVTLLDCGPGSIRALGRAGIELSDVRRVVFSHYHLDHCLDLFALAFARRNPRFEPPELELFGPVGLADLCEKAPGALGRWAQDPRAKVHEISVNGVGHGEFRAGGLEFRCVANGHCPEAVSWRIELPGGRSMAYSGDTGPSKDVARLARGVDLFLIECSFPDEGATDNHLTPTSAARMLREAGAGACLLTHFYPEMNPELAGRTVAESFDGEVHLARDGAMHLIV